MTHIEFLAATWRRKDLATLKGYISDKIVCMEFTQTLNVYGDVVYVHSHATLYLVGANLTMFARNTTKLYKAIAVATTDWYIVAR